VNGLDIWGPNYSISSIGATPTWFRQAFQITGTTIGLRPGQPSNPTPVAQGEPVSSNADPSRWAGTGYTADNKPNYVQEPVPDWTFKTADQLSLSDTGVTDIKNFETTKGPRPADTNGKQFRNVCDTANMIGYGHVLAEGVTTVSIDGNNVDISNGITDEQAFALLKEDLKNIESTVKSAITNPITQQQYDALVDFAWNVGVDRFKSSAVVSLINDKKYDGVPTEMMRWVLACGAIREELVSRRRANALRFAGIMRAEAPAVVGALNVSGAPNPATNSDRAQVAFDFFVSQGWSGEQSAGIVGNLIQESNLNPAALNPRENAQGIAQWTPTGGRQARVASFLGKPVLQSSFEEQLRAIQWELNNGERSAGLRLRQAVSVDQATAVVDRYYERSAGTELAQRVANARSLLAKQRTG
jgi:GH24 family phage-related lysozyme (muramidase)